MPDAPSLLGCADFSRSSCCAPAAPRRRAAGCPRSSAGMPMPAGTGLSRRSFLARSAGLALSVFGASALSPRAFEAGIAPRRPPAPRHRC